MASWEVKKNGYYYNLSIRENDLFYSVNDESLNPRNEFYSSIEFEHFLGEGKNTIREHFGEEICKEAVEIVKKKLNK